MYASILLEKLIIAFKAQRLAELADKVWDENAWSEATMQEFLNRHMKYKSNLLKQLR